MRVSNEDEKGELTQHDAKDPQHALIPRGIPLVQAEEAVDADELAPSCGQRY